MIDFDIGLYRWRENHEVLATEREPEGQAQRSKLLKISLKISTRYRVEMMKMLISGRRPYHFLNHIKNNFLPAGQSKNNLGHNLYITANRICN